MIHFGPAGVFGAPPQTRPVSAPTEFRAGDTWRSPRGVLHTVLKVERRRAHLLNLNTQRTANRAADDLGRHPNLWTLV